MKKEEENKAEQMRFENFERQKAKLIGQGYVAHEGVISIKKANVMAFVTAAPFAVLMMFLYMIRWGGAEGTFEGYGVLVFVGAMAACIIIHEFLHGLTWHFYCKEKWKSIYFGFMVEQLTPYCHCKEPLAFGPYLLGGLMPFLVLGLGISILGIVLQNFGLTFLGMFNIIAAGGDTTIACILVKYRNALIIDHPKECGFIAFTKPE